MAQAAQTGTHLAYIMAHEIGHSYVKEKYNPDHYWWSMLGRDDCVYGVNRNNMWDDPTNKTNALPIQFCDPCATAIWNNRTFYNYS